MQQRRKRRRSEPLSGFFLFLPYAVVLISLCYIHDVAAASTSSSNRTRFSLQHPDASALLRFKSKADLWDKLDFYSNTSRSFCQWRGVTCYGDRIARLVVENLYLGGELAPDSLSQLDQLRVLSLRNASLNGPIPNLSTLINLKSLFLNLNNFSGSLPFSVLSFRRIRTLDLSFNSFSGPIPSGLVSLDRLTYLRLDSNRFTGSVPAFNQSLLQTFNVSANNLTGAVPVTDTLHRFGFSSFAANPHLCGEIVHRECRPRPNFFGNTKGEEAAAPPPAMLLGQSANLKGEVSLTRPSRGKGKRIAVILAFSSAALVLVFAVACFIAAVKKKRQREEEDRNEKGKESAAAAAAAIEIMEQESELEEKVKRLQATKSGSLLFCAGEAHLYTLDQLMRASAELLGRGTMGTTYKAVLDNRLIVSVKRLDAVRLAGLEKEGFERHMESVGALRHPNLVPLRAYFQAKEERLLIYDYQPNGSLSSLVHGTKSTRAKPLHWTSCLKIAEDVAQGLSYIHQAWQLVHGNLKSSNVLLGPDFEACIADYCLVALTANSPPSDHDNDTDAAACRAPETRNSFNSQTAKSDVYSFGILLLELLTGKLPSQLPVLPPDELVTWIRSVREDDGEDGDRLGMLSEVAVACSLCSQEQRPTMWQVLKMLQEIKETAVMADGESMDSNSGLS